MGHLGMELHSVYSASCVLHRRKLGVGSVGRGCKAFGQFCHLVAMAHPYLRCSVTTESLEDNTSALGLLRSNSAPLSKILPHIHFRMPKLTLGSRLHGTPESVAHLLKAVADAKDRCFVLLHVGPDRFVKVWAFRIVH